MRARELVITAMVLALALICIELLIFDDDLTIVPLEAPFTERSRE